MFLIGRETFHELEYPRTSQLGLFTANNKSLRDESFYSTLIQLSKTVNSKFLSFQKTLTMELFFCCLRPRGYGRTPPVGISLTYPTRTRTILLNWMTAV